MSREHIFEHFKTNKRQLHMTVCLYLYYWREISWLLSGPVNPSLLWQAGLAVCHFGTCPHGSGYNWLIRLVTVSERGIFAWDEIGLSDQMDSGLCSAKWAGWCLMLWNYYNGYDNDNGFWIGPSAWSDRRPTFTSILCRRPDFLVCLASLCVCVCLLCVCLCTID